MNFNFLKTNILCFKLLKYHEPVKLHPIPMIHLCLETFIVATIDQSFLELN